MGGEWQTLLPSVSTPIMREPRRILYRRSPHLLMYWSGGHLVFENYAAAVRIAAAPITFRVLQFFDEWRPAEALFARMSEFSRSSLQKALNELAGHALLERSDRHPNAARRAMQTWKHWNPAAGFFHFSTKDVHRERDWKRVGRLLRRRARNSPPPSPVKHYPHVRQISLPAARTDGEFPGVLLARRTWRRFSSRALRLAELGTLLGLAWGVQRWCKLRGLGRVALKTAPSGGALHPVEVYVLALRVAGLPRGLYHYAADRHRLELLRRGASPRQVAHYLPSQGWYGSAAALLLMTAVFRRTQWKYRFPRAYRAVLIEAGHGCQTFCLAATWLGLAPFCTMALADSRIEQDLGLDGVTESVLYAAGVGTRPRGVDWAPWPEAR